MGKWHDRLEAALGARNPALIPFLNRALSERKIRRILERGQIGGCIDPLVEIYSWRNGTRLTPELVSRPEVAFLPGLPYHLIDIELAVAHFDHARVVGTKRPTLAPGVGRYFPLFWDGSTAWLATDLGPSQGNRLIVVDHDSRRPFHEAYASFDAFIEAAIDAIEQGRMLKGLVGSSKRLD